ncbi:type II toxin-antitoxin system RelE/ParE family toxin [Dysgonomonas sp. 521]|uniref:type II toxin-antitoxin system RelE/ParE family toxin n=1 Tax=Dysgonomonas sp. 521 TaxID=2302932 RepID=UPI0013D4BAA0|nr:type II toxin-antitoxin system RelE/ParE family toxin [Dysgonomonas sp. 521]NDV97420.1 type II toxin-antitoxin system RelE/ParE family toxin [Dysgonomonas sp. 521]
MVKIVWLPKARKRVKEIHSYYKGKSKSAANKLKKDIKSCTAPLCDFPQMGTLEPNLADLHISFRFLVVRNNYKIIYYIDSETVYIATVWDCRQDNKKLKSELI